MLCAVLSRSSTKLLHDSRKCDTKLESLELQYQDPTECQRNLFCVISEFTSWFEHQKSSLKSRTNSLSLLVRKLLGAFWCHSMFTSTLMIHKVLGLFIFFINLIFLISLYQCMKGKSSSSIESAFNEILILSFFRVPQVSIPNVSPFTTHRAVVTSM